MVWIWVAVLILSLVVEATTSAIVAIWFAVGATFSLLAACFGAGTPVQILVFFFISFISLFAFLFFYKKRLNPKKTTNLDALIHSSAPVEKKIEKNGKGRVKVASVSWQAEEKDGREVEEGEWVEIVEIRGVTLVVKRIN